MRAGNRLARPGRVARDSPRDVRGTAGPARGTIPSQEGKPEMITISHTHADGTLIEGSSKGDGVYDVLKGLHAGWRYMPSIRQIGLTHSRDRNAHSWKIDSAAQALRAAGHDVTVTIDESDRRTFAEAEAERVARADGRAERMAGYASNAAARSAAGFNRADQIASGIPFGQPILVGHHSERRHRKDLERIDRGMRTGIDEARKAEHYERRAENAENYQASRENLPRTLRRIATLEADERRVKRDLIGRVDYERDGAGDYKAKLVKPTGGYLARLESRAADLADQLTYWRGIVAAAEQDGVKVWGPADFTKGDFVRSRRTWYQVERVNAKSLSVPHGNNDHELAVVTRAEVRHALGPSQWSGKITYDDVTGRKSADEMAALMAEAERRLAEQASA